MSEPSDIDNAVAASLERLGVKPGAAASSEPKPTGEIDLEKLASVVAAKLRPADAPPASSDDAVAAALRALAGADTGPRYKSPGAPSGAPPEVLDRDATKWSRDYIDRLRSEGTFKAELEKFRNTLPGGSNGLFRKRIPSGR